MRKRLMTLTLVVVVGLLSVVDASAKGKPAQRFMAKPFEFVGAAGDCGDGSAAGVDTVEAAWVTHEGLPDAGKSDHALSLVKSGPTANCAAAGAKIQTVEGITLTELGFDVRNDGDCGTNAPRFEIVMSVDGLHTVGCAVGVATETLTDRRGQTWSRKRWTPGDLTPAITPASGTVVSITIVFDDGEEVSTGQTFLDNIDVNGTLIGKPGLAKAPAH